MKEKVDISQNTWLDIETGTIHISIDRVTVSMIVEDFLDFFDDIDHARIELMKHPDFVVCLVEEGDDQRLQILPRPDEDDYS